MKELEFMKLAFDEAKKAYENGEVPIGAVIVRDGRVLSSSGNMNRQQNNPVRHAEIIAIEKASETISNERLINCDLYVTKEPCAMCAGAIVHSRIERVYIGARDGKYGACGTVLNVCGNELLNHVPEIIFGIMEDESALLLREFFRQRRV